jgi:hypothetical protein
MNDSKLIMEACIALIKLGKHDLATRVCELFLAPPPDNALDESAEVKTLITKQAMESLMCNVNLKEVVEDTVKLKENTFHYGVCPFCEDQGASFVVLDYHYCCDRCGAYGNAIQFLMQEQRMTFQQAYKHLLDTYGDE